VSVRPYILLSTKSFSDFDLIFNGFQISNIKYGGGRFDGGGAILKNEKSPYLRNGLTDCRDVWHGHAA